VKRKVIVIAAVLLCLASVACVESEAAGANVMSTASIPRTYCGKNFFVKDGDVYRMSHNQCPQAQSSEVVCVTAKIIDPGSLIVWPENEAKQPMLHALTYAGIQNKEIVLTRDPGPSIRLPIKGIFTQYGILDIEGYRIILDIVYPDKIKAKVRHAAQRCRCR
jgi:hypothetical protein